MKTIPHISHRLIAAAVDRDGCDCPKPARNETSALRLPGIATAIPLELVADAETVSGNRPPAYARDRSAVAI